MASICGRGDKLCIYFIAASEPTFGRYVTLQRVSSGGSNYGLNWKEVIVQYEAADINSGGTNTVRIAVDTNL